MRSGIALTMAVLAVAAAGSPSRTESSQVDELSLAELLGIKLQTGSFLDLDLERSPLSMTVIERSRIELSGARDLSELLEIYVPGFQYMYNRWNGKIWGMRGVVNDRNTKFIVLINGHKMNTEARDGFFQETSMGLFGDVERIEVLRGSAGLVYGSGAIAGIVNIVTRIPEGNGGGIEARAGTWGRLSNTFGSFQGGVYRVIAEDETVAATFGWERSDGLGDGVSRIYGHPMWPYPYWVDPARSPSSLPADGSAHQTPGNWKTTLDYGLGNLRLYGRATHQVVEAGGLFILDPWPRSDTAPVLVDGRRVSRRDPFWSQVDPGGTQRNEYVADNIVLDASWTLPFDQDELRLRAGFDGNSNVIQRQIRNGYDAAPVDEGRKPYVAEASGERRYTLGATWLTRRVPDLQLALGAEQRWDDIGSDLFGRNLMKENPKHGVVSDVLYSNTAVFTEGWYDLTAWMGVDFGLRWDGHTRTIDDGGNLNGKLAGVCTVAPGHVVKLIFQTSSNNGAADNYEYNRYHFDDEGNTSSDRPHFESPVTRPNQYATIIEGVDEETLHSLESEKVYSFELASMHSFGSWRVEPSVSYNMVRNLFAWSQTLFRVVNVGEYDNLNLDLQLEWTGRRVEFGASHAVQLVVNTDVAEQAQTFDGINTYDRSQPGWFDSTGVGGPYYPVPTGTGSLTINPVHDMVTSDGRNFMSLSTHATKAWIDVTLRPWLVLHNDVRVFWGLWGQDSAMSSDAKQGRNNLDMATDPIAKWNASLHADLPDGWSLGVHVYDILGSQDPSWVAHTIRWQETYNIGARDLYSVDLRSYAVDVRKEF